MSAGASAADLPRGRRAAALGAVRTAVRRDLASLLDAGTAPDGGRGGAGPGAAGTGEQLPLVLVALSGGADSLALAAATGAEAAASRRRGGRGGPGARSPRRPPPFRVGAVVVDHRWSPASAGVCADAADAARALGLDPVEVVTTGAPSATAAPSAAVGAGPAGGDGPAPGEGPNREARARDERYAALEDARRRHRAVAVLLGHTADDQAEQVLLGLARGSGARSLAGMPAVRGVLRRPLLGLARAVTAAACREGALRPWSDPSNTDPAFARARVRHRALPALEAELGPGVAAALVRSADQLREDADALDALAGALVAGAVTVLRGDGDAPGRITGDAPGRVVVVDPAALAGAAPALLTRVLRTAALRAGVPAASLTRAHVLSLLVLLDPGRSPGPRQLPGRVVAERCCGTLRLWTRATQAPTSPRSS